MDYLKKTKSRILVVDDNQINRSILKKILEDDYEVEEAENGRSALKKLEEHGDIVAVLLDLRMPVMDGFEFMHVVRKELRNETLPILAVTAVEGSKAEFEALAQGADDYLAKPVIPQVVKKRLENAIRLQSALKKASHDTMTGLFNRNAFFDQVETLLQQEEKSERELQCAFFVIDLDDFKKANDTLGHTFGDQVLMSFGKLLQEFESENLLTGRLGGDEFAMFLYNYEKSSEVEAVATKCMEALSNLAVSKLSAAPTCSIGISLYPSDGHDVEKLYYMADQALYESKGLGKNRFSFFGTGRSLERKSSAESKEWILDEMDSYLYICDALTHEVYYANAKALQLLSSAGPNEPKCFCYLLGLHDKGFTFCSEMKLKGKSTSSKLVYSEKLQRQLLYRGKLIDWDGHPARLAMVSET